MSHIENWCIFSYSQISLVQTHKTNRPKDWLQDCWSLIGFTLGFPVGSAWRQPLEVLINHWLPLNGTGHEIKGHWCGDTPNSLPAQRWMLNLTLFFVPKVVNGGDATVKIALCILHSRTMNVTSYILTAVAVFCEAFYWASMEAGVLESSWR